MKKNWNDDSPMCSDDEYYDPSRDDLSTSTSSYIKNVCLHFVLKMEQYREMRTIDPNDREALSKYLYYLHKWKIWSKELKEIDYVKLQARRMQNHPEIS